MAIQPAMMTRFPFVFSQTNAAIAMIASVPPREYDPITASEQSAMEIHSAHRTQRFGFDWMM